MTQKFAYSIQDKVIQLTPVNNEELGYEIIFKAPENSTEIKPDTPEFKENEYVAFDSSKWSLTLSVMIAQLPIMQCANTVYEGTIHHQGDSVICKHDYPVVAEYKKFYAFKINDMTGAQKDIDTMKAHLQNSLNAIDIHIMQQLMDKITQLSNKDIVSVHKDKSVQSVLQSISNIYDSQDVRPWMWVSGKLLQKIIRFCGEPIKQSRTSTVATYKNIDIMLLSEEASKVFSEDVIMYGTNDGLSICGAVNKMESLRDRDSFSDLIRGLYLYGIDINVNNFKMCKLDGAFDN